MSFKNSNIWNGWEAHDYNTLSDLIHVFYFAIFDAFSNLHPRNNLCWPKNETCRRNWMQTVFYQ